MDGDLKVQLDDRQDLLFLQEEFRKYLENNALTTSELQRQRFLEDVFAILDPNIQIDGIDVSACSDSTQCGGEVDAQLEVKLENLQAETDQLLVQITELRRRCPEAIQKRFALELGDLEKMMPGIEKTLAPLDVNPELDGQAIDGLLKELERLRTLNTSIPVLVAKLKRAQTVLSETSADPSAAKPGTQPTKDAMPESLSEILSRQRRITRQHDLAAKLLAQS